MDDDTIRLGADVYLRKLTSQKSLLERFLAGIKISCIAVSLVMSIYAVIKANQLSHQGNAGFLTFEEAMKKKESKNEADINDLSHDAFNLIADLKAVKKRLDEVERISHSGDDMPMFDCSRVSGLYRASVVNYDVCFVDTTNGAMNNHTGVFNVTVPGIYQISFTCKYVSSNKGRFGGWSDIFVNNDVVADSQREYKGKGLRYETESSTHTMMLLYPLEKGDLVKVQFNKDGNSYMHSDRDHDVHFTARMVKRLP